MARDPSPRRFALWAGWLVLPLVAAALIIPWARRQAAATGPATGSAAEVARATEGAAVARTGEAAAPPAPPAPPRRDGPTAGEIEANRAAQVALAQAQRGWQRAETLAPRPARPTADGELVAPFQGFGLAIESTPPGASVLVAGRDVGETPLVTSVACAPGEPVAVRVERRPLRPATRTVRCRADALVTVQVALSR